MSHTHTHTPALKLRRYKNRRSLLPENAQLLLLPENALRPHAERLFRLWLDLQNANQHRSRCSRVTEIKPINQQYSSRFIGHFIRATSEMSEMLACLCLSVCLLVGELCDLVPECTVSIAIYLE